MVKTKFKSDECPKIERGGAARFYPIPRRAVHPLVWAASQGAEGAFLRV